MQFEEMVRSCLRRWGQAVRLDTAAGQGKAYRAMLQPLRYKNKLYLEGIPTDLGNVLDYYALYYGPANPALPEQDPSARVVSGDAQYTIRHTELIRLGDDPLYCWAVLRRVWKEDADGIADEGGDSLPEEAKTALRNTGAKLF